jgi:lysophospholipase L1-like esterase
VQSVFPRDGDYERDVGPLNSEIRKRVKAYGSNVSYIDLTPAFSAAPEVLRPELTDDALHLNAKGYALWAEQLAPYLPK